MISSTVDLLLLLEKNLITSKKRFLPLKIEDLNASQESCCDLFDWLLRRAVVNRGIHHNRLAWIHLVLLDLTAHLVLSIVENHGRQLAFYRAYLINERCAKLRRDYGHPLRVEESIGAAILGVVAMLCGFNPCSQVIVHPELIYLGLVRLFVLG